MLMGMAKRAHRPHTPWHRTNRWRSVALVILLLVLTIMILYSSDSVKSDQGLHVSIFQRRSLPSDVPFAPTVEFVNGTDVIWQIPTSPKAILFLAHGCNGKASNFWDRSQSCLHCVGLPEERLIVIHALDRKFAVITISSTGNCWSYEKDKERVKGIIRLWVQDKKLEKLPLTALGASSGGYFVSALANELKFSGIAIMIAEGEFKYMKIPDDYPPTLFVHMPKDRRRAVFISEYMEMFKKKGIAVSEIKCMEIPLTPKLLSDRIPGIEEALSVKIFETLQESGIVDKEGFMKIDGRHVNWMKPLRQKQVLADNYEWSSHIEEELNLAYAYHEITSLPIQQILDWFLSHMN